MNYFIRNYFLSAYLTPDMLDFFHIEVKDKFLLTRTLQSVEKGKQTRKHFQCRATNVMIGVGTGAMRHPPPKKRHLFNSRVSVRVADG